MAGLLAAVKLAGRMKKVFTANQAVTTSLVNQILVFIFFLTSPQAINLKVFLNESTKISWANSAKLSPNSKDLQKAAQSLLKLKNARCLTIVITTQTKLVVIRAIKHLVKIVGLITLRLNKLKNLRLQNSASLKWLVQTCSQSVTVICMLMKLIYKAESRLNLISHNL